MTQLLLVRHGEPLAADAAPGARGADPGLSPRGAAQASAVGWWVANTDDKITEIVVSPMRRARETALPAQDALGLGPVVDDALVEFDVDRPAYRPVHERPDDDPDWERIKAGYYPEFVDTVGFSTRVLAAFDTVLARHAGRESVLVVCHAGVINTYLASILGLGRPLYFPLEHGSVSRVLVSRGGDVRVRSVNETGHVADVL